MIELLPSAVNCTRLATWWGSQASTCCCAHQHQNHCAILKITNIQISMFILQIYKFQAIYFNKLFDISMFILAHQKQCAIKKIINLQNVEFHKLFEIVMFISTHQNHCAIYKFKKMSSTNCLKF